MNKAATDRRSFLKTGAIAAAPLAVAMPTAALADDGSHARLARLEDEKAIAALHREVVGQVNRGKRKLADGLTALADDPAQELQ
ncbi:MAG: twin-arginine translocation signal domain-containing protein, partial [Croceibacterium sp.]